MNYAGLSNDSAPPGAPGGAEALTAAGRKRAAARLLLLCRELARLQTEIDRLSRDGTSPEDLDAALDAWWATVEAITSSPATTSKSIRSKASALRTVLMAVGRDRHPEATALLASLLADLLGEAVQLP